MDRDHSAEEIRMRADNDGLRHEHLKRTQDNWKHSARQEAAFLTAVNIAINGGQHVQ